MARAPLPALSSPQTHPSLRAVPPLCGSFQRRIFSVHLKDTLCPPERSCTITFVPHCPTFLLCSFQLPRPDPSYSPPISGTSSTLFPNLSYPCFTLTLSHVTTSASLYLMLSQSLHLMLPPGFFPLSLLNDSFCRWRHPTSKGRSCTLVHPQQRRSQQSPSGRFLPRSCQTLTADATTNKGTFEAVTCQLPEDHNRIFMVDAKTRSPRSAPQLEQPEGGAVRRPPGSVSRRSGCPGLCRCGCLLRVPRREPGAAHRRLHQRAN